MPLSPSIIACGGLIFITTPFPHGSIERLIPSYREQRNLGVEIGLRTSSNNDYFVVTVINEWTLADDPTEEGWDKKVKQVLQHVWEEMVSREIVDGPMPEIIEGNPLDMLPK